MSSQYSNHREQFEGAKPSEQRLEALSQALEHAFAENIEVRQTGYILFDQVTVDELTNAFVKFPVLIKSVLALANVATRAVKRDLNITIDTYADRITLKKAAILAGYIKPILPKEAAIPSIVELDRYFWTDKEMRAGKGRWEKKILKELSSRSQDAFKKRKFEYNGEQFELDAASPAEGPEILVGVDVKRIEAQRDIHKRSDEIINKASKFKSRFPKSHFFAVIYYPFPSEHQNVQSRVSSNLIDGVFFANDHSTSISDAVQHLLAKYRQSLD